MARVKFIAGNWKMNLTRAEARTLVAGLAPLVAGKSNVEVAVCPTFTALDAALESAKGTHIKVGAQNCYAVEKDGKLVNAGAYTGEISAPMLADAGVSWVILGHSERRQYFGETDAGVSVKARAVFAAGLKPIICVGETLAERDGGRTLDVVEMQTRGCLAGLSPEQLREIVIAYEPVWAIGTGRTATPEQAQEVHAAIRRLLGEIATPAIADLIRIQYGGSMNAANAAELLKQRDIDGGLIGGAALKADTFAAIIAAAAAAA